MMTTTNKAIKLITLTLLIIMLFQPVAFAVENGLALKTNANTIIGSSEAEIEIHGVGSFVGGVLWSGPVLVGSIAASIPAGPVGLAVEILLWYIGAKTVKVMPVFTPKRYKSTLSAEELKHFKTGYKEVVKRKRAIGYHWGMGLGTCASIGFIIYVISTWSGTIGGS